MWKAASPIFESALKYASLVAARAETHTITHTAINKKKEDIKAYYLNMFNSSVTSHRTHTDLFMLHKQRQQLVNYI